MPTTTNFGWTTPADTDLVKDGAAAIRTLGSNIDTSLVDLKGGTTGQYLQKNSNTDLDYVWANVSAGGMTLISTTSLSGSSVTLSSIPQTYKELKVVIANVWTNNQDFLLKMRFNGDTGINYGWGYAAPSDANSGGDNNTTSISLTKTAQTSDAATNARFRAQSIIELPRYTDTSLNQSVTNSSWNGFNRASAVGFGFYGKSAAITSITIFTDDTFAAGTVYLYGVQ